MTSHFIVMQTASPLKGLLDCLEDVKAWMALNFLNINEEKTEVTGFGPCDLVRN